MSRSAVRSFGVELGRSYSDWDHFVSTDWTCWDRSEYIDDIWCRSLIQLAIEQSSPDTSRRLAEQAESIDAEFVLSMTPAWFSNCRRGIPLRLDAYFWEFNTIHPELRWRT